MKRNHVKRTFALAASALAISTAVVGCRDYDQFDEVQTKFVSMVQPYEDAFINRFGMPDPNHDWGMDEHIGVIGAFSSPGTRTGEIIINRNQWTEFNSTRDETFPTYTNAPTRVVKVPNFRDGALGHDIQIPGFPHLNGLYYTANGTIKDPDGVLEVPSTGAIPAGDVTPYEIQFVSNWFRTHKNPVSNVELHLSDFFIQNVSCDNDQVDYKESGYSQYKPGWEKTGCNGENIQTKEEARTHRAYDGTPYVKTELNEKIDYFLDKLEFQDIEGSWTHVNNFNSGNSNHDPEKFESNPNRMIMYVKSSGTENFHCHPSWCTDTEWIDKWVLVRLTWYETVKDERSPYPVGTVIPREGYYLGFDFYGKKSGQEIERDGYYSNWIVKITPGFFSPLSNSKRIFCEDLGGSFDFDFNDAVVDVAFEQKGTNDYEPIITVQAAGGTMPIYVQKENTKYELHRMLGKKDTESEYKPINVGASGGSHTVAIYRGEHVTEDTAGAINIYVKNTKNSLNYNIKGGSVDASGNASSIDVSTGQSTLDGNTRKDETIAPSAFSAPTSVKWLKELQGITLAYEHFPDWVAAHNWMNGEKHWYDIVTPGSPLYDASVIEHGTGYYAPPTNTGESSEADIDWRILTPDETGNSTATVASVGADSYLRVEGYTGGQDAVFRRLDGMGYDDRITCVLVMSSTSTFNQDPVTSGGTTTYPNALQGILVPANIVEGAMYNHNKTTAFDIDDMKSFKTATYVDDEDISNPDDKFAGKSTYTLTFSFKKSDLVKTKKGDNGAEKDIYQDYLLFFLKGPGITTGGGSLTDGNGGVKVERWYVHY